MPDYLQILRDNRRKRSLPAPSPITEFVKAGPVAPSSPPVQSNNGGGFFNKVGDVASGTLSGIMRGLELSGRPGQALLGAVSGEGASESLSNLKAGWLGQQNFTGEEAGFARLLSDKDFIGDLSARDIGAAIATELVDPINYIPGALIGKGIVKSSKLSQLLLEPVLGGGGPVRALAGEIAVGLGARTGSELARDLAPEPFKDIATLAGGLVGGGVGGAGAAGAARGLPVYRDLTKGIPIGGSLDVEGGIDSVIRFTVEDSIVEAEGQLVPLRQLSPIEVEDIVTNPNISKLELEQQFNQPDWRTRGELVEANGGSFFDSERRIEEGIADEEIEFHLGQWSDSSSNTGVRDAFDDLLNDTSKSLESDIQEPFNFTSRLWERGEDYRQAVRQTDPYYNPNNDTVLLFRGERGLIDSFDETRSLQTPPQSMQSYTTDPGVAAQFTSKRSESGVDKMVIARQVPVNDLVTPVHTFNYEPEILVWDSTLIPNNLYSGITLQSKTTFQLDMIRDKPFKPNPMPGGGVGRSQNVANNPDLVYEPSPRAIEEANLQQVRVITMRNAKGHIISSQLIDEVAANDPRRGIVPAGERMVNTESVHGGLTPEARASRALQDELAAADTQARFAAQQVAAREQRALTPIEGQTPERIQIPQRSSSTDVPADVFPRRWNPERVRAAPNMIASSMESRRVQLNTFKKTELVDIAIGHNIETKGLTKTELAKLITAEEYKGAYQPLYSGVATLTGLGRPVSDIVSTDMPVLLQRRVASTLYDSVNGSKLPPVLEEEIARILKETKDVKHDELERASQMLKMTWASMDGSFWGIQGLQTMADWFVHGRVDKIAEAIGISVRAFGSNKAINEFFNRTQRYASEQGLLTLDEVIGSGAKERFGASLHLATIEGNADIGVLSQGLKDIPAIGAAFSSAERNWASTGDMMRVTQFYDSVRRYGGKNLTDEQVGQIINGVNRVTGISAKNRLGTHANILLFAPRFIQSQLETVVKAATDGGIEGHMARRGISSLIGFGVTVTVLANELRALDDPDNKIGTNTDFRLWLDGPGGRRPNSNFMRIKNVFGTDVSVFGPWDTFLRNVIQISQDPIEGSKDVFRSKSGPLVSIGWNVWSGETFFGEDFNTPETILKETFLPFAWRDVAELDMDSSSAAQGAFSFFGVKASPLSASEAMEINMRNAGRDYDDPIDRRRWIIEHPEDKRKATSGEQEASELVRGDIQQRAQWNELKTMNNELSLVEYTENRRILSRELRNKLAVIFGDDYLQREPRNEQERWVQEYYKLFELSQHDITHDVNGTTFDRYFSAWVDKEGPEALAYLNEFNLVGKLELETQYLSAIRELDQLGYFDMPRLRNMAKEGTQYESQIMDLRGQVSAARLSNPRLQAVDYSTAAWQVLRENGYSGEIVRDVVNAGKDDYQSREFQALRKARPDLTIWFNPNATYATLQQLQGQGEPQRASRYASLYAGSN